RVDYDELRRIIREDEPPRPSARLSTLRAEALTTAPERRGAEARKLVRQLRGELDWIVMKALEKDRTRRYETANGFAADVQRYLNDEPVLACPPSRWYRFGKFARRHKRVMITINLVGAALLLGTGVSSWQAVRATRAEGAAQEQRRLAQRNVQRAL